MGFYKEFELDKICDLLQDLSERCEELYLICNECGEHIVAMDPSEMNFRVQYIFGIYTECTDRLHFIDSKLADFPIPYICREDQELLHNQIISYLEGVRCISNLYRFWYEVFEGYTVGGTLGNPANISGIVYWQRKFCKEGEALMSYCKKMIVYLTDLEQKEQSVIMECVYASPEFMGDNTYSDAGTDGYPFLHADLFHDENKDVSEKNQFEDNMTNSL